MHGQGGLVHRTSRLLHSFPLPSSRKLLTSTGTLGGGRISMSPVAILHEQKTSKFHMVACGMFMAAVTP